MASKATSDSSDPIAAKVIVIGDSGVGKTNLLTRFCQDDFKGNYVATIGVDFKIKSVRVKDRNVKMQIWDTAGQERYRNITQIYYKGSSGILLVYSITCSESFRNINSWINQIDTHATPNVPKLLVGSKCDLQSDRSVTREEGQALAARYNMRFLEISGKTGEKIQEAFETLASQIVVNRGLAVTGPSKTSKTSVTFKAKDRAKNCAC